MIGSTELKVSIKVPTGPFDFDADQIRLMAILGKVFTELSAYEYSCDEFIFTVVEHYPDFIAKHKYSPTFNSDGRRREFIVQSLRELECLSELCDADGRINIPFVDETMKMVWHHRVNLTHGRLYRTHRSGSELGFFFQRWARSEKDTYTFDRIRYDYDVDLLKTLLDRISYLRSMLLNATECARGGATQ